MKNVFKTMAFTLLGLVLSVNLWGEDAVTITTGTYKKQTGTSITANGSYILLFSGNYILCNTNASSDYVTQYSYGSAPTSITITNDNKQYVWVIKDYDKGNFKLVGPNGEATGSKSKMSVVSSGSTWTMDGSYIKTTGGYYIKWVSASGFRCYNTSGNKTALVAVYKLDDAPAFTITAQSNDESLGTVSLSGSKITASPKEGCRYANPAYTVSPDGSATVKQEGNEFTVTPTKNCTVQINFEAIPKHKVYFSANGTIINTGGTEVAEGADITFPETAEGCDGKTFMGWVGETDKNYQSDKTAPTYITSATMGKQDITYYAVFADKKGDGGSVTITNDDIKNSSLEGSYAEKTITVGTYTFTVQACKMNDKLQMRDHATLSFIQIPELPGAITNISSSACSNSANPEGNYTGILHFKSAKTRGNANTDDIDRIDCSSGVTSINWDVNNTGKAKSGYLLTSAGLRLYDLTISYGDVEISNYTTTCAAPKVLTGITIKTEPTKKTYTVGDDFDPSGLVITASYDDATSSDVNYSGNESMFAFEGNDISTTGNKTVTVKYTEGGVPQTATYNITVNAKAALESISVNTDNCQTNFIKNEEFKSTGLVVTAHYVGGATETVSPTTINSSGYTMGSPGTYTIYVSYTDESGTKETSYDVYVWELSASSNNTALGKVNRSKYVITATPETGVTYADPAYTVTKGSADVVQGTDANINKFTVSNVTANTTVTINFVEKDKDTYIDQMHGQLTTGNVFYDSYNAPNINYSHTTTGDNCIDDHIYFVGWTETPTQVGSSTAPADMFAAGKSMTAGGKTYYAVWAGGEVTTFAAANTSNLTKGSGNTWTDNTTGLNLTIADGQLYTSGSPKTFTVNGKSYMTISHTTKKLSKVEVTLSDAGYEINSVTPGTLSSNSTSVTSQTITNINATSVKCSAPSGTGTTSQIRATQIKVTCLSDYLTACCTPLSAPNVTVTAQTTNSLTFSWEAVTGATGYEYKLSTADNWTTTTETSATISGLEAGTEYTIQVRATDNTGNYCATGTIAEKSEKTYYNTEIYISTPPNKTVYVEGETFDKEGMVVWYTHEATKNSVSNAVTWTPDGALTPDVKEITVSYKVSDDLTLTTTQAITVKARWTVHYSINGNVTDKTCAEGEAADVPEVVAPDGFTFTGWVTEAIAAETPTKPTYALQQNQKHYTPSQNNEIFYAVFERKEATVKEGSILSVVNSSNTFYVGAYTSSYFYSKEKIEDAMVFFFDEEDQMYAYDNNIKKYVTLESTGSGAYFNATVPTSSSLVISSAEGGITIACYGSTENRMFARNNNQPRFASYKPNQDNYCYVFNQTPKKIEVNQSYYNTVATVPTVHHIEVKTAPAKTTYFEGDKFDATGLVVWAYYSADDEVGKEVPASQYTLQIGTETDLDNYELKAVDDHVVISFRNAQCSQPITVNAITLNSITVTTPPTQTKYTPGAAFNPAGMVVFAVYNDTRKNKDVPLKVDDADGYTYSPATLTELGEQNVTISYTDGTRGTQTTTTPVTVNSALNEIRVKINPDKMTYIEGELFDKTGMVVEGSYGDPAEWKEVTGWTYTPTTAIVAKGTLATAEQRDITIHYSESGVDKETVLKVTVQPYPRYTVTFSVNGNTDLQLTETTPEGGITIPANPAAIGDYTFVGWAEATMAAESPEKPAMITEAVGATYHITADNTLYAVYSMEKEGDLQGYTMSMEVNTETKTISYFSSKEFMPTDGSHTAMTLYFANGCLFYMDGNEANYVYFTDLGNADLTKSTYINQAKNYLWTEENNDDGTYSYYRTNGTSTRYLGWNSSSSYWRAYNSSYAHNFTKTASGSPIKYVMPHYTTSPETAKTPEVKFTTKTPSTPVLTNAADHTSLATYFNNTLSSENTTGTVVYTLADGDDAVATIAADGTVTAKKAGSVTVTATVGAVAGEWKEASASYTLTFTKIAPTIAFDDNQPTEVYVGNVVTVHATSNSDAEVKYSAMSGKISVNATTGEVTGLDVATSAVNVYAHVDATDLFSTSSNVSTGIKVKSNAKTQTLTFAKPEGYDFAPNAMVDPFINTLSGAKTTVTYSLKDGSTDGLVILNATTGEVSVNTNLSGSAIVVATAEAGKVMEEGIIWAYGEATAEYAINVSYFRPVLTLTPGLDTQQELWRCTQTVTMTAQEGDKIYYTINGGDPTTSSTLYENPFEVNDQMVNTDLQVIIKAIAVSSDGSMTSPILTKTLTKAVPTMTAKAKDVDVTSDSEIKLDANDVVTLKATACKIDYRIRNHEGTEIEKKVGNATTDITFSKGGTFTLEATPRWSNTNGFKGETKSWNVIVKGAGHLPINYNGNNIGLAELPYFTMEGTFGSYKADNYEKTQIKIENGTLTVAFLEEPTTLSYHLMLNGQENDGNSVVVQQSADGHSWTTIVTHCTTNGNLLTTNPSKQEGARDPYQFNLNSTTRYVRWTYTKVSGNIGLGSIYIGTNSLIVDDTQDLDPNFNGSVIVENGGKLTVEEGYITDLTIMAGGVVNASEGILTINNLYLQSADHKSGQFLVDNNGIDIEGNAYFDLTLNAAPRTWYDFAVPFKVNRNSISLANGAAMPEYDIIQYNGETRATSGANKSAWEYVDEGDLNPGTFYMIMFASNVETIRFTKNDGAKLNNADYVVVSEYELQTSNPLDANWNGIANNTLQYVNLGFTESDDVNIKAQVYNPTSKSYTAYNKNEVTFVVGAPFFVQVAKEDLVDWSTAPIHDILRAPSSEVKSVGEFTLELMANGVTYDRLFVSASEDATDSYQIGHDLAKMGISTTIAQMWVDNYNTKLCANEAVLYNDQANFPLGVFIPSNGEYTLTITNAPENAELYLLQDGQPIWNLSKGAYTTEIAKGTHSEYGLMLQVTDAKAPTNLDGINGSDKAVKFLKNSDIYILRNAKLYNVQGQLVK